MCLLGGARETEFTRQDAKNFQLTDFHGRIISMPVMN